MIWANDEFTPANGVTGGTGTSSDPYIIEGWDIDAPSPYKAINIWRTDAHFIIRNVFVSAGGVPVINLMDAANGMVENSVVSGDLNEIFIGGCSNFTIRDNSVSGGSPLGSGGFGIHVTQSNNVVIRGNTVAHIGQADISLDLSSNVTVTGNDIRKAYIGIEIYYTYDVTITDNIIDANRTVDNDDETYHGVGIKVGENSDNATIINNTISVPSFKDVDILIGHSENHIMVNNIMSQGGIFISGDSLEHWNTHVIATSNTVIGKTVHYLKNSTGGLVGSESGQVILANCSGVDVDNLDVSGVRAAFQIGFSRNSTITRNHVHHNYWGISVYSSDGNMITQNTVRNNYAFGIHLENSTHNEIADNTFSGNGNNGINLWYSSDNRIHNNTVSFNGMDAVSLWKSDNNTIVENVVLSNGNEGIRLSASRGNRVYHNSIIGNGIQAEDDLYNQMNYWDDGYPSGGNYWSDYTGIDQKKGVDQDKPGSDGIGDTPHFIEVDNQDTYPLVFPPIMPPPQPPRMLEGNLVGMNSEDVAITWALSPDDGMGLDSVVGYEVYRNMTYEWGGWDYSLIASLPDGTTDFVDNSVGEGDPNNYFYMVRAVDVNGKKSWCWNQTGKFTRPLSEGLNLLSIPLIQSDESLEKVLQTVEFDRVWTYDSVSGDWKSYVDSKPYNGELGLISHRNGFWTNITEKSNLTVAGIVPLSTLLQLKAGWNLVPFPSFRTTYTVSDLKDGTGATRTEGLDSSSPPYFLRILTPPEALQAGSGYWVRVENDRIWAIDSA